ncbi:hypothetical protein [Allorhizobium sonneratiae]|uniref:hypothetical protein n=1 Tax=Allorhizobium sonneratiae TaxID=2934936 RepID=UPI00203467F0|nr:hypothetical protein [Allorhizobium sonneratiae]
MRLQPALNSADYENLRSYMLGLVMRQALPPLHGGRPNWKEIGATCRLSAEGQKIARREGRHAFEAIMRWLNSGKKPKEKAAAQPVPAAAKAPVRPAATVTPLRGSMPANGNNRSVEPRPTAPIFVRVPVNTQQKRVARG